MTQLQAGGPNNPILFLAGDRDLASGPALQKTQTHIQWKRGFFPGSITTRDGETKNLLPTCVALKYRVVISPSPHATL